MSKQSFDTLVSEIKQCSLCAASLPLTPRPIFQVSKASKVLIAGQAPGLVTHDKGRPFDDKSGQRLRKWLGIDETTFYSAESLALVPMGFCYPGKGKSGDLPPIPLCADTWRQPLMSHLSQIKLTVLVGQYAYQWHKKALISCAMTLTDATKHQPFLDEHQIIVLPHPSPRNNLWLKKNPWFEQDTLPILKQRVADALLR
ncbi:uracil-DNA glycosylase family protein [Thalassotalea euphylliae]|uniref:uracil-DNA glycosylase family protein n=1 Tax=Thalassotalea euphylliae TaxID=1655234 RepID=UPI00363FC436